MSFYRGVDYKALPGWLRRVVYEPHDMVYVFRKRGVEDLVADNCCASVHEGGRSVGFRQCANKAKHQYAGFGWCSRHLKDAKEAETRRG